MQLGNIDRFECIEIIIQIAGVRWTQITVIVKINRQRFQCPTKYFSQIFQLFYNRIPLIRSKYLNFCYKNGIHFNLKRERNILVKYDISGNLLRILRKTQWKVSLRSCKDHHNGKIKLVDLYNLFLIDSERFSEKKKLF